MKLVLAAALLSACGQAAVLPVVRQDRGRIRIDGLPERARQRLLGGDPSPVRVSTLSGPPDSTLPSLAGRWEEQDSGIVFVPRFEPSGGISVAVSIDTAAIAGRRGPALIRRFPIPTVPSPAPLTEVTIYPSAAVLPENLLRWYLEFSEPMRPGQALSHVRLENDAGQPVANAWLEVGEELWSPDRRRLTLLFDPGRVKRGIRTNLEQGRPLVAGRWYRLAIDSGWRDARDRPLRHAASKRFRVGAALYTGPDPASWWVDLPRSGTSAPITVRFIAPIDHALGPRLVAVVNDEGQPMAGRAAVDEGDLRWSFFPASPWPAGGYRLAVSPELEDVAGNRPGRPFDRELAAPPAAPPALTRSILIR